MAWPFYLSGGTALSRGYLQHRYSDDLDFFMNRESEFLPCVDAAVDKLVSIGLAIEPVVRTDDFVKFYVKFNNATLKIEWINDVAYTFGNKGPSPVFVRTDHWQNILSNKLSALGRNESKDFADLLVISQTYSFDWLEVIEQAKQKDQWVDEIEISRLIQTLDIQRLREVNWISSPDLGKLNRIKEQISKEIILGMQHRID
ncbi:MAG: nucleotidyl transferase AbiEii/AbiGii toxin family protein [Bacteroidota bacterium]